MARQTPVLQKTFVCDTAIPMNTAVVLSTANPGNVALPTALASKFIGFTVIDSNADNVTTVMTEGIAQGISDGSAVITAGDYLAIANTTGQVKTVVPASGTNIREIIGIALNSVAATAGLFVDVFIQPGVYLGA
jgi:hypothetical protein